MFRLQTFSGRDSALATVGLIIFTLPTGCCCKEPKFDVEPNPNGSRAIDLQAERVHEVQRERVDRWIHTVLLKKDSVSVPIRDFVTEEAFRAEAPDLAGFVTTADFNHVCLGLSTPEILIMINAGPIAIERLIEYVDDTTPTHYIFHYPLSSRMYGEGWTVGQIACYMIEAILRRNPYFTISGGWTGEPANEDAWLAARRVMQDQMASAYRQWVQRCLDSKLHRITCSADDLPRIPWDYDLDARWRLKRVDEHWQPRRGQ